MSLPISFGPRSRKAANESCVSEDAICKTRPNGSVPHRLGYSYVQPIRLHIGVPIQTPRKVSVPTLVLQSPLHPLLDYISPRTLAFHMDRPPKLVRRRRSARSHSAKTEILKFDHWIYGDLADSVEIKFNNGTIESNEIGSWLCQPSPTTYYKSDWRQPCAGLRLLCRKHEHSTAKPFDDETMRAINDAMGISSSHSYITRHDAGICGKYMSTSQQPGKS